MIKNPYSYPSQKTNDFPQWILPPPQTSKSKLKNENVKERGVGVPPFCRLRKFYFLSDIPEILWFFLEFIWGHFGENFFSKNLTLHWWCHHSWTLVSRNFSCKRVSIFCMLLCCSCLRVGVMSYRILYVTKLIPNYYSQWRHNHVIMTS